MTLGKRKVNIILDTNWYISASINQRSRRVLFKILTNTRLNILYCKELLIEYQSVIVREKFENLIFPKQVKRFLNLVVPELQIVTIQTSVSRSRDDSDNYLLSLCLDGNAEYLITGDPDLLVLKKFEKTKIVRMNDFLKLLEETIL